MSLIAFISTLNTRAQTVIPDPEPDLDNVFYDDATEVLYDDSDNVEYEIT